MTGSVTASACLGLLVSLRLFAQATVPAEDFAVAAKAGTAHYQDATVARAHGFKRVGVEFPFMGEHWVNFSRVVENRYDPSSPSLLIYATVRGARRLVGVGYTALLGPGESPPRGIAAPSDWHEHNGSVTDESFPIHDGMAGHSASDGGEPRLSVLHAWVWEQNPAGVFTTENSNLPFLRLGVPTRPVHRDALRAAAFAMDSSGYYELMLRTGLQVTEAEWRAIEPVIARHRTRSAALLHKDGASKLDEAGLRSIWASLWDELSTLLPGRAPELQRLTARL